MTHFFKEDFKLGMVVQYVDMTFSLNGSLNIVTCINGMSIVVRRVVDVGYSEPMFVHDTGGFELPILKSKIKIIQV